MSALGRHLAPLAVVATGLALILAGQGCGSSGNTPPPPPTVGGATPSARPSTSASASAAPTTITFNEADFTESDSSRDPFHPFAQVVRPTGDTKIVPQYQVVLEKYSIDELKLVAIVNAGGGYRAMFVDPSTKGHIVTRGMHIGRGEIVKLGPGAMSSYPLYWKIDRIKASEVVLVREDALHPDVAPTYREIQLHTEGGGT